MLIIPHGDAHTVSNGSPAEMIDSGDSLRDYLAGTLSIDARRRRRRDHALHLRLFRLRAQRRPDVPRRPSHHDQDRHPRRRVPARGSKTPSAISSPTRAPIGPAAAVLLAKASEALFVEALRRYMEQLPPEQDGWLAGARDPIVGAALALLHRKPFHAWTLNASRGEQARRAPCSCERFDHYLGEPPLTYLTRWRLQLASRLLETSAQDRSSRSPPKSATNSEAAFNRAFKREFGAPPARYRKQHEGKDSVAVRESGGSFRSSSPPLHARPRPPQLFCECPAMYPLNGTR